MTDILGFVLVLVISVVTVSKFSAWTAEASQAGLHRTRVVQGIFGLAAIAAIMLAIGLRALASADWRPGFLNWTLIVCGGVSLIEIGRVAYAAAKNYRVARAPQ